MMVFFPATTHELEPMPWPFTPTAVGTSSRTFERPASWLVRAEPDEDDVEPVVPLVDVLEELSPPSKVLVYSSYSPSVTIGWLRLYG